MRTSKVLLKCLKSFWTDFISKNHTFNAYCINECADKEAATYKHTTSSYTLRCSLRGKSSRIYMCIRELFGVSCFSSCTSRTPYFSPNIWYINCLSYTNIFKSSKFATSLQGISGLGSAFMTFPWLWRSNICFEVTGLHNPVELWTSVSSIYRKTQKQKNSSFLWRRVIVNFVSAKTKFFNYTLKHVVVQ